MLVSFYIFLILNFTAFAIPFNPSSPSESKDSSDFTKNFKPSNVAFIVGNLNSAKSGTATTVSGKEKSTRIITTTTPPSGKIRIGKFTGRTASMVVKDEVEEEFSKPSLAVVGFEQSFLEPQATNFGFLPVFPWPKKLTKTVDNLFPHRGNNEWFAPPRSDPRLSQFPAPTAPKLANTMNVNSFFDKPFRLFNRNPFPRPPPSTTTPRTTTTSSTTTTSRPTTMKSSNINDFNHNWNFGPPRNSRIDSHDDFRPSSPTTTPKTLSSPPGIAPPDWNGGVHEAKFEPPKTFRAKDIPQRIFSSKSKSDIRKISIFKKELTKKQKINVCRTLNPAIDSILHPKTDKSCDQRLPDFKNDFQSCRCKYIVAYRDYAGCATKYYSLCFRV